MTNNNPTSIARSCAAIAVSIGDRIGVRVVLDPWTETAFTNGQVIVLGRKALMAEHKALLWGFLIHEAAHIRFTAYDCMKSDAVADKIGCPRKIFHKIWNMFEDAFIERKVLELFPGAIGDLTEARRHLVATGNYPLFTAEVEFPELVIWYGFYRAMVCSTNQRVHRPNMDNARAILAQAVDPSDLALLDAIIDRSAGAECSMDNIEIARDLFLWLKDHYSEPALADEEGGSQEQEAHQDGSQTTVQNAPEGSEGAENQSGASTSEGSDADSSNDESSQGSTCGSGEGTEGDENQSSGASTSEGDADSSGAESSQGSTSGSSEGAGSGEGQASSGASTSKGGESSKGTAKALNKALSDIEDALEQPNLAKALQEDGTRWSPEEDENFSSMASIGPFASETMQRERRAQLHQKTSGRQPELPAVERQVSYIYEALKRRVYALGATERQSRPRGRIDARRINRLMAGDLRVFRGTTPHMEPNAAVKVLVDLSGSMSGVSLVNALAGAFSLQQAFARYARIPVSVDGFNREVEPITDWEEPSDSVRRCLNNAVDLCGGCTSLLRGLTYERLCLARRREKRKLLLVLTDGLPTDCHVGEAAFKEALLSAQREGIQVFFIGIGFTPSVHHTFSQALPEGTFVNVNDVDDLGRTMFDIMGRSIVDALNS